MSILILVVLLSVGAGALISVKVIHRTLSQRQLQHTLGSLRSLGERITRSIPLVETHVPEMPTGEHSGTR